ncbi:MAG TPA: DUF3365 domain-containing protein [Nitrospira sp.]|nr:DUF3365 domain-containing protein [Nitrospira sp.]
MRAQGFGTGLILGMLLMWMSGPGLPSATGRNLPEPPCIPATSAADYVHSVIQADRTFYTTEIVERMQVRGTAVASEHWKERGVLPLPAQFLKEAGLLMRGDDRGIRVRLVSRWPINKDNRPNTDFERTGLSEIMVDGGRPYTAVVTQDGTSYFQALYPDKAVSQSCIGCHNTHPDSPKKDFKLRDVMGGILVTMPLPQSGQK